jgi:hypothetical protein
MGVTRPVGRREDVSVRLPGPAKKARGPTAERKDCTTENAGVKKGCRQKSQAPQKTPSCLAYGL